MEFRRVLFLFQAEDGIRDHCVTGVQTCALFISSRRRHTRSLCDWSSDVCSSDLAYPGHGILAEESGNEFGAKNSDYVWIIDPLDGTTNFIHGFPVYCVSIALSFKGKVEHAVVYDPSRNDLFTATRGRGADRKSTRLNSSHTVISYAVFCF